MSDLEWYLDVGGKQSGPHTAKEIVEMVRSGKIPATSQVTAARMSGDWVVAQDLIDAYDELYAKPSLATPIMPADGHAAFSATVSNPAMTDPNYAAPPRPTEQLEKSKIITLNREELDRTPDPTEALFQAILAAREKTNQKGGSTGASTAAAAATRDTFGQLSRPAGPRVPPQLILILALAGIFGLTIFGVMKLAGGKKVDDAVKTPVAKKAPPPENNPAGRPPGNPGGLLNDQGGGSNAARTTPPVQPIQRGGMPGRVTGFPSRGNPAGRGGARYRDDRDPPVNNNDAEDVDESDTEPNREVAEPMPVDPSQVPTDRIIPEPGTIPGRGPLPGSDPYVPRTPPAD
jgi:hypothetical protein